MTCENKCGRRTSKTLRMRVPHILIYLNRKPNFNKPQRGLSKFIVENSCAEGSC